MGLVSRRCSGPPLFHYRSSPAYPYHLSLIVPAYQEQARLPQSLERLIAFMDSYPDSVELVLSVDGGSDRTLSIATAEAASRPDVSVLYETSNRGKGHAVRRGMLHANGRYLLFTDADLSTPIEEAPRLLSNLVSGHAQIAVGSRRSPESDICEPQGFSRRIMGRAFNGLVRGIGLSKLSDTQCGFKAMTSEAARELVFRSRIDGFAFDVELLAIAKQHELVVTEVPVTWRNDLASRVNPIRDSIAMTRDLVRIWWRSRGGF